MTRMNWTAANDRARIQRHGAESIDGLTTGQRPPGRKTDRRTPPRVCPISETIEIAKFWRNRQGEAVIVCFREYQGRALIDCRVHFTNKEGKLQPTNKGLSLVLARLPDLAAALNKAMQQARALGLLPDDGGEA
jgi:Transcriptional Coactivator p15 (PC4)